ncbi:hypothetical protein KFE25_012562 [Diacronema lutheri]|uniref:Lon N-terminal domain-containing protein n=1 Tax=Diacronema lutheri TaxID=2081491 RepID=A0A8J5XRD8_DIALT|nr:hypothetical protein KFE25_012562 [Diacronema lutheri]
MAAVLSRAATLRPRGRWLTSVAGASASARAQPRELRLRSALSTANTAEAAIGECLAALEPAGASVLFVWLAGHASAEALAHVHAYDPALAARTLGSTAYSLLHASRDGSAEGDVETLGGEKAVAMTAAWMPATSVQLFALEQPRLPELDDMRSLVLAPADRPPAFLLCATPRFASVSVLRLLDAAFPGAPKVGMLADCADAQEDPEVFAAGRVLTRGAVGVALSGNVTIDVVASCGLRPITGGMATTFTRAPARAGSPAREAAEASDDVALALLEGRPAQQVLTQCERLLGTQELRLGVILPPVMPPAPPDAGAGGESSGAEAGRLAAAAAASPWAPLAVGRRTPDGNSIGVPVVPSSHGLALAGARAAVCAHDATSAALDMSIGLAKAHAALARSRGALVFGSGARSSSATRTSLFGASRHDVLSLRAALDESGNAAAQVCGAYAGSPICALVGSGRTHILPESLVVASFRELSAASGAPASAQPPAIFSCGDADRAAFGGELPAALTRALDARATALQSALGPGPAREEDVREDGDGDAQAGGGGARLRGDDDDDDGNGGGEVATDAEGGAAASLASASLASARTCLPPIVATGAPLTLPVFDLRSESLFPQSVRQYIIFEPRYRLMLAHCLARSAPLALLGAGGVGCVASVAKATQLHDGRFLVQLAGTFRCVLERSWIAPHAFGLRLGAVRAFADRPEGEASAVAASASEPRACAASRTAREAVEAALRDLAASRADAAVGGEALGELSAERLAGLSDEAASYVLSDALSSLPIITPAVRARWLRTQSTAERLSSHARLLRRLVDARSGATDGGGDERAPS